MIKTINDSYITGTFLTLNFNTIWPSYQTSWLMSVGTEIQVWILRGRLWAESNSRAGHYLVLCW